MPAKVVLFYLLSNGGQSAVNGTRVNVSRVHLHANFYSVKRLASVDAGSRPHDRAEHIFTRFSKLLHSLMVDSNLRRLAFIIFHVRPSNFFRPPFASNNETRFSKMHDDTGQA